jgi:hypothetical protein
MKTYHLAQINIARMRAPLDSPVMAGFVAQLSSLNALAEASRGFVWRLQTEGGEATALRAFEDPLILVNMSVWASVEDLQNYAYHSAHVAAFRERQQWFEKMEAPHLALWWVPAGHVPTPEEAKRRLSHLHAHGPSPIAFTFARQYPPPEGPGWEEVSAELQPDALGPSPYDCRVFELTINTENGTCTPGTRFFYRQQGTRVWATYEGEGARFGTLVAVSDAAGRLTSTYQHLDAAGSLRNGRCRTRPERLADGRLRLHEEWQWIDDPSQQLGYTVLDEVQP